jgi:hypothetical protein
MHDRQSYNPTMTWSARRIRTVLALWLLLTFSLAAAWGRKPPEEEEVKVTLRPLSTSEAMDILHQFPEMVPDYLGEGKNDTQLLKDLYPFSEVKSPALQHVFPDVRFYKGLDRSWMDADLPYMLAIAGDKSYWMPAEFNGLLLDNGMKVTDKNIIELTRLLVIAVFGSDHGSYPEITLLGATKKKLQACATDAAQLKVMIGGKEEEWHFTVLRNQFDGVSRFKEKRLIKHYLMNMVTSPPKR